MRRVLTGRGQVFKFRLNRLTDEIFTTNLDDVLDGQAAIGLPATATLPDSNRPMRDYHDHYSFDLTGNRLSKTTDLGNDGSVENVTDSNYDANDRLLREALDSDADGDINRSTLYGYHHTQQTQKTVATGDASSLDAVPLNSRLSTLNFQFDLQGRLSVATNTTFDGTSGTATHLERTAYGYDATGIRVSATTDTLDPADGTTVQATERVEFLNDPQNFTGYSQVIRETHRNGSGQLTKVVTYTFGHDEISQTTTTFPLPVGEGQGEGSNGPTVSQTSTLFFAHDGHGSVRALLDAAGAIATVAGVRQLFTYDAYGNAVGFNMAASATVLLYSGEQFDQHVMMQYLRARYYDQTNGRLPTFDPFLGDGLRPTTFNKYAYTSGDPIRFADPSGLFEGLIGTMMSMSVGFSNRGKESGGSLSVLNSVYRAKDGIDFVYGVAGIWADLATGNYAGVAKSLLGVDASEIKQISQALLSKNLTNLGVSSLLSRGAPITLSLDLPDSGKLGKALRFAKNWIGKSNKAQEVIGEVVTYLVARLMNFKNADLPVFPKVQ